MHMIDCSVDMVFLDFLKSFDKVDNGILLHKLKALGITEKIGMWFYNFLTHYSHFVKFPGGISADNPVLSGIPILFVIIIADITLYYRRQRADVLQVFRIIKGMDKLDIGIFFN